MFEKIQKLTDAEELRALYPVNKKIKDRLDDAVKSALSGNSGRRLMIAGPCSLDESGAVFEYLEKLKSLEEKVKEKLLLIPRLYTAKPRSRGGYTGLIHADNGLTKCREILSKAVNDFNFAVADELLYPFMCSYFSDAVSYYAVGTRSSLNQEHRFFASGLNCAVGFKNPVNGDLGALADSVAVCKEKNTFFKDGFEVCSSGNHYAHGILRGYTDCNGAKKSNFDAESVSRFNEECNKRGLSGVPLIIDFSHDNSGKDYMRQVEVARQTAFNMRSAQFSGAVRGFMIESYLFEGRGGGFGYSLTDGCLSYEQTEALIMELCEKL